MDDTRSEQIKALGDPVRLRMVALLPTRPNCPDVYNVSELAEELGLAQPTVSHHLKVLKQARLVRCRKMCRDVYYWVDRAAYTELLRHLRGLVQRGPRQPE